MSCRVLVVHVLIVDLMQLLCHRKVQQRTILAKLSREAIPLVFDELAQLDFTILDLLLIEVG